MHAPMPIDSELAQTQQQEVVYSLGTLPPGDFALEKNPAISLKHLRSNSTESSQTGYSEEMQVSRLLKGFGGSVADDKSPSAEAPSLQIEYFEGTPCKVADEGFDINLKLDKRSTTVEILCSRTDGILEVREDRTCHYNIKIGSKEICNCPGFAADELHYTRVSLFPASPIDPEIEVE